MTRATQDDQATRLNLGAEPKTVDAADSLTGKYKNVNDDLKEDVRDASDAAKGSVENRPD